MNPESASAAAAQAPAASIIRVPVRLVTTDGVELPYAKLTAVPEEALAKLETVLRYAHDLLMANGEEDPMRRNVQPALQRLTKAVEAVEGGPELALVGPPIIFPVQPGVSHI